VGDGNFHAALIFDKKIPGEFEKVDAAAHRVSYLFSKHHPLSNKRPWMWLSILRGGD
jgi:hypothetical protein